MFHFKILKLFIVKTVFSFTQWLQEHFLTILKQFIIWPLVLKHPGFLKIAFILSTIYPFCVLLYDRFLLFFLYIYHGLVGF